MAQRTTIKLVREVLDDNYNGKTGLQQFIDAATVVIDRVATCAIDKGKTLTAAELELIERWLAAHFYTRIDTTYASRSVGGASGSFHGQTGTHLDASFYGQTAANLDYSGCLIAIIKRQVAQGFWGGTCPDVAQSSCCETDES